MSTIKQYHFIWIIQINLQIFKKFVYEVNNSTFKLYNNFLPVLILKMYAIIFCQRYTNLDSNIKKIYTDTPVGGNENIFDNIPINIKKLNLKMYIDTTINLVELFNDISLNKNYQYYYISIKNLYNNSKSPIKYKIYKKKKL